jgi:uridine kinase
MPPDFLTRIAPLFTLLEGNPSRRVIAIDGRCGSGKSTLAALLAERMGAGVICMDDFFLPSELRTAQRYAKPGGNIHHERFAEEVMPFLRSGEGFTYRIFDCRVMDYNGVRFVPPSRLRVVEGAYSHHPVLGGYMDVRVFSDVDAATQRERIEGRNGAAAAVSFIERWIPYEEAYITAYGINQKADVIV